MLSKNFSIDYLLNNEKETLETTTNLSPSYEYVEKHKEEARERVTKELNSEIIQETEEGKEDPTFAFSGGIVQIMSALANQILE